MIKNFCWSQILNYKQVLVIKDLCVSLRICFLSKILNYKRALVIKDLCVH